MKYSIGDELIFNDEPFLVLGFVKKSHNSKKEEIFLLIEGVKSATVLEIKEADLTKKKPTKRKSTTKKPAAKKATTTKKSTTTKKTTSKAKKTTTKKTSVRPAVEVELKKEVKKSTTKKPVIKKDRVAKAQLDQKIITEETPIAVVSHDVFSKKLDVAKKMETPKWFNKKVKENDYYKKIKKTWELEPHKMPSKNAIAHAFEYNKFSRPITNRFVRTSPIRLKAASRYYKTSSLPTFNKIGVAKSFDEIKKEIAKTANQSDVNSGFVAPLTPEPKLPVEENPLPPKQDFKKVKNNKLLNKVIISDEDNLIMDEISNKDSWYDQITEFSLNEKNNKK